MRPIHPPEGIKNREFKNCPECKKLVIGELRSFCRSCGHSFGSDRWFSLEGEATRVMRWD